MNLDFQKHIPCASLVITCSIFIVIISNSYGETAKLYINGTVPAVIAFGDSIVDPGNNNYIKTIGKCNFPPYGRDFMGGKPTGRFSNGRIPSDFIVEKLGAKNLLPAYLDPNLVLEDLLTGVSFASGGSGYDPLTPKIASSLSLDDQLKLFNEYMDKIKFGAGRDKAAAILSQGLFIVSMGSNDIANTYFITPIRKTHYDINSYTDLMLRSASSFFHELYRLGARKVAVLGLPPIGCVPFQRTLEGGLQRECSNEVIKAAILFNSKLSSELESINKRLLSSAFVYIDVYNPLLNLIQYPAEYGFEVANKGCCGTGIIETIILCNKFDIHTCTDASKYIFWDSYHPSEKAYNILTSIVVQRDIVFTGSRN